MTLTKDDLKEIKKVVDISVNSLALITKRGFDAVDKRFDGIDKKLDENAKTHILIRKDISNLEFIATEMVRRDEFLELKQRLSKIEAKLGLVKYVK